MSIASELQNYADGLDDAYDAVDDMSGIIPQHKNMDNLDQAIRTIPQSTGPTPGDGTLTIQQDGSTLGTFTANQSTNTTVNITSPGVTTFYFTNNVFGPDVHISIYSDQAKTTAVPASTVVDAYKRGKVILVGSYNNNHSEIYELSEVAETTNSFVYLVAFGRERSQVTWAYSTPSSTTTMNFLDTQMEKKLIAGSNITLSSDVNATTISATDTTYSDFTGATSLDAGSHGLVPAPVAGDQGKVLTGDGSWTDIFNLIYPVGSIYMSVNNTDPGTLFGGTWTQIQDSFILAAGSTYAGGTTGGAATINLAHSHTVNSHNHSLPANTGSHTLTVNEMPSHTHSIYFVDTGGGGSGYGRKNGLYYNGGWWGNATADPNVAKTGGDQGHTHSIGGNTGDKSPGTNSQLSSTQSILPPYLAVYVWKRTA